MKKARFLVIVAFTILTCLMLEGCSTQRSIRQSQETITGDLKAITPLGTQYEVAVEKLEARFKNVSKYEEHGFLRQDGSPPHLVGARSIEVHLGDYHNFPMGLTSVNAFWGFDSDGRLIDVWLWKTTDAL